MSTATLPAQIVPPAFKPAEVYDARGSDLQAVRPYGLAIADVIGPTAPNYAPDGLPDVAVANNHSTTFDGFDGRISIYRNTGNWADDGQSLGLVLAAEINVPRWAHNDFSPRSRPPYDLAWADMDNDSDLDLVFTTGGDIINGTGLYVPPAMWVIRNDGNGVFTLLFDEGHTWAYPYDFQGWKYPGLAVGLLSSDILPDVACGGEDDPLLSYKAAAHVFRNTGTLEFDDYTIWTNGDLPTTFGTALVAKRLRFRGANRIDLAMSLESGLDGTFVLLNGGGADFSNNSVQDGQAGYGLEVTHFRLTGTVPVDMVATKFGSGNASARVMFFNIDGVVTGGENYPLHHANSPGEAWGVATGKLNNDTKEDFVVAFGGGGPWSDGGLAVFINNPASPGTFLTDPYYFDVQPGAHPKPTFVRAADMNDDGHPDMIVSNTNTNTFSVLINGLQTIPPP